MAGGERVGESGGEKSGGSGMGQWEDLALGWWVAIWMDNGEWDISGCINGCTRAHGGVCLSLALKLASQDRYLTSTPFPAPEAVPSESACRSPALPACPPTFHQVLSPPQERLSEANTRGIRHTRAGNL